MKEKTFKKKLYNSSRFVEFRNGILIGLPEKYVFDKGVTISGILEVEHY